MIKRIMTLLAGMLGASNALAQDTSGGSFWDDPVNHPMAPFYLVAAFILFTLILVLVVAMVLLRAVNMLIEQTERRKAAERGIAYVPRSTGWSRLTQKLNASVPVAQEQSIELDHNFDGIRELDNHLPPWWKWLFYGTIAWSVVYLIAFHLSDTFPLSQQEYEDEVAVATEQIRRYQALQPQAVIDEEALKYTAEAALIEKGKTIFLSNNCGSCHRSDGGGNSIGPNLTDMYWIHGGGIKNVFNTIKNGVVEKGMPAWGKVLSPTEMRDVTFYILSLQGTRPANAKAPQGELFKSVTMEGDSTKVRASL